MRKFANGLQRLAGATMTGALSKKTFVLPDVDSGYPVCKKIGKEGDEIASLPKIKQGSPDVRSAKMKFGLLIPMTNTSMESELWHIIYANREVLNGVGIHTTNVQTPMSALKTKEDLVNYKKQFLGGLETAVHQALAAEPQYFIVGMSMEHIIGEIAEIRKVFDDLETKTDGMGCATWHDAAKCALEKFGAKNIALLTPFDKTGNGFATQVFTELGFNVVSSFGFSCGSAVDIAHVPDEEKERVILEYLLMGDIQPDAIVQCGTNFSLINVAQKLEGQIGIPILGINATTFWYALREVGIDAPLREGSRLLREF